MLRNLFVLVTFAVITLELVSSDKENKKCQRKLDEVEKGRECRKSCKKDKDCKGKKLCQCDDVCGMSCFNKEAECEQPPPIENGIIILETVVYGSTVRYECNEGYVMDGKDTRTCRSDKKWSGKAPKCQVGCSRPPRHSGAFVTLDGNGFEVGTVVNFKCRFGFNQVGSGDVECLKNFTWSEPQFRCIKLSCGNPGQPLNGYVEGNDFSFGNWAVFQCNKGYINDNPRKSRIHCSSTGRWSGGPITCSKRKCEQPVGPENGFVDISDLSLEFESLVNYHCNFGYKLVGNTFGHCNEDGNWGEVPTCTVDVNCNFDGVENPLCGYTNNGKGEWERQFESENTASGDPSYVLKVTSTPAVLRSPVISSSDKHCFKFSYYISRLRTDDSLTINTQNGRTKIGGVWKQEQRLVWQTQQLTINPLEIFGGIQFEITQENDDADVAFDDFSLREGACERKCFQSTCSNGICVDRVKDFECLCDRFHRGKTCRTLITCPDLPKLDNGWIEVSPDPSVFKVDTKVKFSCNEGYDLIGVRSIECQPDGNWSKTPRTRCQEILCPVPPPHRQGFRTIKAKNPRKMSIGTVVTYSCPIGMFLFSKDPIIVCNKLGRWSGGGHGSCLEQTRRSLSSPCPTGFRFEDPMCYRVVEEETDFVSASSLCSTTGASLAVIRSAEERSRIERLISRKKWYYVGLTNIGREKYVWADGEIFAKIASERYRKGFSTREDLNYKTKCGGLVKYGVTSVHPLSCAQKQSFICQTFSINVLPIEVIVGDPKWDNVKGIYRPVLGLQYNEAIVYKLQGDDKYYLFRSESGWTIGGFSVHRTQPLQGKDIANTNSTAKYPQDIAEIWTKSGVDMQGKNASITVVKYDLWTDWTSWGPCSKTCGTGRQEKTRKCSQKGGSPGYGDCLGQNTSGRDCNTKQCIITRWGNWENWSRCSAPCGGGTKTRERICIKDPESSEICTGKSFESSICGTDTCNSGTTKWKRYGMLEYKIHTELASYADSEEGCTKDNGTLATINDLSSIDNVEFLDFLETMFKDAHCKSKAAYLLWKLWVADSVETDYQTASGEIDVMMDNGTDAAKVCQSVEHECENNSLIISSEECIKTEKNRRICERKWRPCNSNPCGKGGVCKNVEVKKYKCECYDNYRGRNCKVEIKCGISKLRKAFSVTYADSGKIVKWKFVKKGIRIRLDCSQIGQATTDEQNFECIGENKWNMEPKIKCETACTLPRQYGRNITIKYEEKIAQEGTIFFLDSLLVFECPDSMELVGNKTALCTKDGWDVKMNQSCESAVTCKNLTAPENGTLGMKEKFRKQPLKSGTTVTLSCEEPNTLTGLPSITCLETGDWSGELGECTSKSGCILDLESLPDGVQALNSTTFHEYKTNVAFEFDQFFSAYCDKAGTLRQITCTSGRGWKPDVTNLFCN